MNATSGHIARSHETGSGCVREVEGNGGIGAASGQAAATLLRRVRLDPFERVINPRDGD